VKNARVRRIIFGESGCLSPNALHVLVGARHGEAVYAVDNASELVLSHAQLTAELELRRTPWRTLAWIGVLGMVVAEGVAFGLLALIGWSVALLIGVLLGIACSAGAIAWLAPRYSVSLRYTKDAATLDAGVARTAALRDMALVPGIRLLTTDGARFTRTHASISPAHMPICQTALTCARVRAGRRTLYFMPDAVYERHRGCWQITPYHQLAVVSDTCAVQVSGATSLAFARVVMGFASAAPLVLNVPDPALAQRFAHSWRGIAQHAFLRRTFTAMTLAHAAEANIESDQAIAILDLPILRVSEVPA
jgi:hypothetical protein